MSSPEMILIKENDFAEFETPTGKKEDGRPAIYYADDKDDAESTARFYHGQDCEFRHIKGTYGVEE